MASHAHRWSSLGSRRDERRASPQHSRTITLVSCASWMNGIDTYSKLANFHIVNTKILLFRSSAKSEDRQILANEIENVEDDQRADKRVAATCN